MNNRKYSAARDWAYHHATQIEGNHPDFYLDKNNVPTISIGVSGVFKVKGGKWTANPDIAKNLKEAGVKLSRTQVNNLNDAMETIAGELSKSSPNQANIEKANSNIGSITVTPGQSHALFDQTFKGHYKKTQRIATPELFNALGPERQGAITMQTYQTPTRVQNASEDIQAALKNNDNDAVAEVIEQIGRDVNDPLRAQPLAEAIRDPQLKGKGIITNTDGNLSMFAKRHGVSWQQVAELNKSIIIDADNVRAGTVLRLPDNAVQKEEVYKAYGEQGIDPIEADKHWAAQFFNEGGHGKKAVKMGLTVSEAKAIFDTAATRVRIP